MIVEFILLLKVKWSFMQQNNQAKIQKNIFNQQKLEVIVFLDILSFQQIKKDKYLLAHFPLVIQFIQKIKMLWKSFIIFNKIMQFIYFNKNINILKGKLLQTERQSFNVLKLNRLKMFELRIIYTLNN
ncbi:hypothetical protein IMG5_100950 [Ichthyophthirius multifiliis]|uniref:Uncharacterized protein n=1 Tax=Ichthyophthirius multifiliis TaxID=5932 RepID=G0QSG3_ICHMU|nr:hypothetical protein IMG5_100950 [Ichthyophthirius multifiliis]EGR31842.1 hypothetical protein IMG5_100950 [Ichthyophthirius multifiliis]|eukprot:XP_004035328.1 hypothetical protein IMG5_100950 [Ichthyophthirius multifiliis]